MLGKKSVYEYEGFGFKFGMYASSLTEQISGTNISGLIKRMGEEGKETTALLHYFYGAAVAYEESKKSGKEITLSEVAEMVESLGDEEAARLFSESLGLPKNLTAPMEETGQK
jgi:hypothetical protein